MSSHPVKRKARPVRVVEGDVADLPIPAPAKQAGFSFRYSYAEISSVGNSARFKAKRASYEDGKLCAESFEGELDRGSYERLMHDAQRFFVGQTALCLRAFQSLFLPSIRQRDRE